MCNETGTGLKGQNDCVIGLNVGGKVFYTSLSTLTRTSGNYFSRRFGVDASIPPGCTYTDTQGNDVHFIDRSGDHFHLILEFMRMGMIPQLLDFHDAPLVWRWLREEAEFYCLEQLSSMLQVVYSCDPSRNRGQGVFHWLGTNKGKSQSYLNPISTGHVRVNCWNDQFSIPDILSRPYGEWKLRQRFLEDRSVLVEHKPAIVGLLEDDFETIRSNSNIARAFGAGHRLVESAMEPTTRSPLFCDGDPVEVELVGNLSLNPTHYSLRWDGDCLMYKWRLEASMDREAWDVIHRAGDQENPLKGPSQATSTFVIEIVQRECEITLNETNRILSELAEEECRRTFAVESDTFYRYFRFVSDSDSGHCCLHGVGFELYGNVSEA